MEKTMADVLLEKIQDYPHLDKNQIMNLNDIFMRGEAIYVLDDVPPIEIIKQFPNFMGEFGLILINNIWLLTVSIKKACYIPIILDNYIVTGTVQFFAHSHPDDGTTANLFPSFPDLEASDAIDHKIYIISVYGITEVDISNADDLRFLSSKLDEFIWDNHISYEYYMKNQYKVYMDFMKSIGCILTLISYDDKKRIEQILNSKYALKDEFWDKKAGTTPYWGKK